MDIDKIETELRGRTSSCELCSATGSLKVYEVKGGAGDGATDCILACENCTSQIEGNSELVATHWYCLKESMWSEVTAVQVISYVMLKKLESESWAQDLLGQLYLSEEAQEWADASVSGDSESDSGDEVSTLDSNGTVLAEGDSVTLIQDLPVKGAGFTAKRGTMVRSIHMIGDPDNIEGRINKMTLVLKTKFLKKVN